MNTDTINISIQKTQQSKINEVDFDNIPFGMVKSDHMFTADYIDGKWTNLQIVPYGNIEISPACIGLHYGQSIFEGMKAYKAENGDVALFRPEENMKRLQRSAKRLSMPPIDEEVFMEGLKKLIEVDKAWVPEGEDKSLYIRPYQFGNDPNIGVRPADTYKFIIFTLPSGKYYGKDVDVYVETNFIRAARGGSGTAKAAGNYAPTLLPVQLAKENGYEQILWTQLIDGKHYVQEIGTMNFFVQIEDILITPPLDGTILEGITRASILKLAEEKGVKVEEKLLSVEELFDAARKGLVKDAFGCGTAAVVTNIKSIGNENEKIELPPVKDRELCNYFYDQLAGIRNGSIEDKHNWMVKI